MPAGIPITRREHSAEQLRRAAARSKDGNAARRLLALAHVMDGMPRGEAAVACGMTGQTLRDWVHRYNAEGLPGLYDRPSPGPKPRLSPAQEAQVKQWVLQGPNLAQHGVVRWRRIDLGREIQKQFGVTLAERRRSARLGQCCAVLACAGCRCGRSIHARTWRRRRHLKKLCRPGEALCSGARARQADRTLVAGRSPRRTAGHLDSHLGRARQPSARAP